MVISLSKRPLLSTSSWSFLQVTSFVLAFALAPPSCYGSSLNLEFSQFDLEQGPRDDNLNPGEFVDGSGVANTQVQKVLSQKNSKELESLLTLVNQPVSPKLNDVSGYFVGFSGINMNEEMRNEPIDAPRKQVIGTRGLHQGGLVQEVPGGLNQGEFGELLGQTAPESLYTHNKSDKPMEYRILHEPVSPPSDLIQRSETSDNLKNNSMDNFEMGSIKLDKLNIFGKYDANQYEKQDFSTQRGDNPLVAVLKHVKIKKANNVHIYDLYNPNWHNRYGPRLVYSFPTQSYYGNREGNLANYEETKLMKTKPQAKEMSNFVGYPMSSFYYFKQNNVPKDFMEHSFQLDNKGSDPFISSFNDRAIQALSVPTHLDHNTGYQGFLFSSPPFVLKNDDDNVKKVVIINSAERRKPISKFIQKTNYFHNRKYQMDNPQAFGIAEHPSLKLFVF